MTMGNNNIGVTEQNLLNNANIDNSILIGNNKNYEEKNIRKKSEEV